MTRFIRPTDGPVDRDQESALDRSRVETRITAADFRLPSSAKDPVACMLQYLRTPLSAILGETGVAESQLADIPASVRRAMYRVSENANRMERVLCDVLDHIDEMVSGRIRIDREPVDLARMLTELIPRIVPLHGQHRIRLEVRDTPLAYVDSIRMERVVGSLVDNALRVVSRSVPAGPR